MWYTKEILDYFSVVLLRDRLSGHDELLHLLYSLSWHDLSRWANIN